MRSLSLVAIILITACASRARKAENDRQADRAQIEAQLQSETSLKADRSELAEIRADIPDEKQRENDELALFLKLMGQGTEQPSTVRDKFARLVTNKRSSFREKIEKLRAEYKAAETKRREDFTKAAQKKRDRYFIKKRDLKASQNFMSEQEKERLRVAAEERERRQSFEAELSTRSKDFESYMRERTNDFNEQLRLYSKKFSEKPRETKAVTGDDFRRMDEMPAKTLGTED